MIRIVIPSNTIELAARAHWNLTATIKWDEPGMKEEWKEDCRKRAAGQLHALLEANVITIKES